MRHSPLLAVLVLFICCSSAHAQDTVQVFWSGALAPDHLEVRARLSAVTDSVRLVACTVPCPDGPLYSAYAVADSAHDRVATLTLDGLQPDREYLYRFEVDGVQDVSPTRVGRFVTPRAGPMSYSFVTGSCSTSGDHPVWQAMRERDPLFFLSLGDLHYRDPNSLDIEAHWDPYRTDVLSLAPQRGLLHDMPIAYVWDDHDFCGDASDGGRIGRFNAAKAYRDYVPHYPLHHDLSVYQSFTIGRVHFILSDLRSTKSPSAMMDIEQFAWLQSEFRYARDHALLAAWISPLTWNSTSSTENWGCQPAERTILNDFLYEEHIKDLFILSGDAHMLAIDDGWNADFSTAGDHAYLYPIFQAAAIARTGSYKGGTFDQGGFFPNPDVAHGQFGEVTVDDDGEQICITFQGWRTDSMSANIGLINSYTFCRTPSLASIPDQAASTDLVAYARNGVLELRWAFAQGPGTVDVFDVTGRVLISQPMTWQRGTTRIDLPDAAAGVALIRVSAGERKSSCRVFFP